MDLLGIFLGSLAAEPVRRLAYSTGSTSTQPAGHAGWGDADFSLVGHNHGELKAKVLRAGWESSKCLLLICVITHINTAYYTYSL